MPSLVEILQARSQLNPHRPSTLPGAGFIPGTLYLDKDLAPEVPLNTSRPFAPGEYIRNPDGSTSSEISMTVQGDSSFNSGQPTVIPSLWLKDGRAYVAKDEAEAIELAKESGLTFSSFSTLEAAESFAAERESMWNSLKLPEEAIKAKPLYQSTPREFIEPPPIRFPDSSTVLQDIKG